MTDAQKRELFGRLRWRGIRYSRAAWCIPGASLGSMNNSPEAIAGRFWARVAERAYRRFQIVGDGT